MKLLPGDMLEIVFTMYYSLTLSAIIGGGVATLRNFLCQTVYLSLIFHIERNRSIVVQEKHHHHQRAYGNEREVGAAPYPEIGFFYSFAHVLNGFDRKINDYIPLKRKNLPYF